MVASIVKELQIKVLLLFLMLSESNIVSRKLFGGTLKYDVFVCLMCPMLCKM